MNQFNIFEGILVCILFIGYILLWRIKQKLQQAKTGIDPEVVYKDPRPTQRYFAILMRVMTILVIILILLHTLGVDNVPGFYKIQILDHLLGDIFGVITGFLGLTLCFIAQKTMGHSWRVGIDEKNKTDLITTGIYKIIRNPTYSGLFLVCIGVWLIFPTMFFLTWGLLFFIMIEFQVRCEEEYLMETHQENYKDYCSYTKRYIPYLY
ncbi:MAG: isoprenylcysteine carboxylmethyltransferase family protein [Desulfamplus sp.]|nr:isoprenylcysteine carboxylmethyltransferase family protein [Desulfamplus sp.]